MGLKAGRVGIHPSQVDPITGMLLSGPSGTSDYEQLSNLPKVNNVTLKGNKSLTDLGIPTSLAGQSDTDITSPEQGQILQYNGTGWENVYASISPVTPATLASLTDVTITDPAAGQTLEYNGTGWENVFASIAPATLAALQDVDITSPADGDYLVYDGTNHEWVNSGSAPTPTYTDVTCTFYGAVEDIISFTDASGVSHMVTFATNASSKQETFKIDPSGSSITFISSVAKNPDDLAASYSKTVSITSASTDVYVMPDNALYWYGYLSDIAEVASTANGWSWSAGSFVDPTFNKNYADLNTAASQNCIIGLKASATLTKVKAIVQGVSAAYNAYGSIGIGADKNMNNNYLATANIDGTSLALYETSYTSGSHNVSVGCAIGRRSNLYALWYE